MARTVRTLRPSVRWSFRAVAVSALVGHISHPFYVTDKLDDLVDYLKNPGSGHDDQNFAQQRPAIRTDVIALADNIGRQAPEKAEESHAGNADTPQIIVVSGNPAYQQETAETERQDSARNLYQDIDATLAEIDVPPQIDSALRLAFQRSGVDYMFLRVMGAQESSFRPEVKASTSNACGLMQIIPSTQIALMYHYGRKYGYGDLVDHIEYNAQNGRYTVSGGAYDEIIEKCEDPLFSALMAAEYARQNHDRLEQDFPHREINYTDIYMYHFLGPGGGKQFIRNLERNPSHAARDYFSSAVVNSNRNVFYSRRTGNPRSFQQIYNYYARKFSTASANFSNPQASAASAAPPNHHRHIKTPAPRSA